MPQGSTTPIRGGTRPLPTFSLTVNCRDTKGHTMTLFQTSTSNVSQGVIRSGRLFLL